MKKVACAAFFAFKKQMRVNEIRDAKSLKGRCEYTRYEKQKKQNKMVLFCF